MGTQTIEQLIVNSLLNSPDFMRIIQTTIQSEIRDHLSTMNLEKEYYTPEELAKHLKVNRQTIYNLVRRGVIKSDRCGYKLRISFDAVNDFLNNTKVNKISGK